MGSVLLCFSISCCSWKGSREHRCMDGRRWLQAATRCVCLQRGLGRTQTAPGELSAARGGVSQHPSISWPRTGLCTDPCRRQGWSHRTGDAGGWDSKRGTRGSTPAWKGAVTPGHPGTVVCPGDQNLPLPLHEVCWWCPAEGTGACLPAKQQPASLSRLPRCWRDNSCQSATFYSDVLKIVHYFQAVIAHPVVIMSS